MSPTPIPDCDFPLFLILFPISFALLCSDPVEPISAAEGADKSLPPDRSCCLLPSQARFAWPPQQLLPVPAGHPGRPWPQELALASTHGCASAGKGLCYSHPGLPSLGTARQTHNKL